MKKEITLGQLLSVGVTLLIAIVTGWVTLNNKVTAHDIEIKSLTEKQTKTDATLERIESKIDKIKEDQTDMKIALEKKAPRR